MTALARKLRELERQMGHVDEERMGAALVAMRDRRPLNRDERALMRQLGDKRRELDEQWRALYVQTRGWHRTAP
ncbi:MAG TPA: hypothetical protein VF420_13275 [Casimicrobiaceae bacterium]